MTSITRKHTRCKNGTRKNKKTGNCESVLDKTCSICLDRIVSGNVTTKCKHKFHKKCLIGWCKGNKDKPTCPICRKDINDTCKKIMPFDSHEAFRYTYMGLYDPSPAEISWNKQKLFSILLNPKFDPNIKDKNGKSLLYVLSEKNKYFKEHVEYMLTAYPNKVNVSSELISELIANRNTEMLQLYKKYKKIPKHLKKLI